MSLPSHFQITHLVAAALLLGCGGGDSSGPSGPGTLRVNVATSGVDLDGDGYALTIDNAAPVGLSVNGSLDLNVAAGNHALAIDGLAVNCDVTSAPLTVNVASATTSTVDISVSCGPYLRNAVVFSSDEFGFGELEVMRPDGTRRTRMTADQRLYFAPAISPDGQSIAVASFVGGFSEGIYLLDRFGKGRTQLVFRSNFDGSPAWSPDGSMIAFRSDYPGPTGADHSRIFIVNSDGSALRQLTQETVDYTTDDWPSWSPDGTQIVFSRFNTMYLIKPDGSGLTSTNVSGHHPVWSPNGLQIAYDFNAIFVMDRNFVQHQLTTDASDVNPRWSPNGSQLLFQRFEGGKNQLYRINAEGSGLTRLSAPAHADAEATWSPLP